MTNTDVLKAPAKLTLTLAIVGVRDDGYHLIDAEMVGLDLADTVSITTADSTSIEVSGAYAAGVPTDERNLCWRAMAMAGTNGHISIHKSIPHGGGLGGGSTDAAAVLRWAGIDDPDAAARIGADVAFCLHGGRARVTGIGEVIDPLPYHERVVTLVIPPLQVSTPAVYKAWDDLGGPSGDGPNDLEPAALVVEPRLAEWRRRIEVLTGQTPVLAGSGATWFVEGERDDALAELVDEGVEVRVARTIDRW